MPKSLTRAVLATALVAGSFASTTTPAAAHRNGAAGFVAGTLIGLGLFGAYAHARDRYYYGPAYYPPPPPPRHCRVVGERCGIDRWGRRFCRDDVRCGPRY